MRVAIALATSLLFVSLAAAEQPPHLLLVLADDCTVGDMECYGGQAETPHINRLCREGMKLSQCFQAAPMCSPTRHCLYTGLYPVKSGAYPNHTFVKPGTKSIAHYLQQAGYRVALSGKRHINPPASFPFEYSGKKNPDMVAIDQLMTACLANETPFCVIACSNEPHTPWNLGDASAYPPDEVQLPAYLVDTPATRQGFSRYLAEITYYDHQVGQLLSLLDKHQLVEDTLVMVLSEQGNSFTSAKWTCYEMGLQSGMVVRWPGHVAPGSASDALVEYVDVVPTLLAATNTPQPAGLDGESFLPVLTGEHTEHKQFVFGLQTTRGIIDGSENFPIRSIRSKDYRYIWNLNPEATFTNAVHRTDWWKEWVALAAAGDPHAQQTVHSYQHRPAEELFRVTTDPHNQHNLADDVELAAGKSELRARLQQWMDAQGDAGVATELAAREHQWNNRKRGKK